MPEEPSRQFFKLIPDEVFKKSAILQELQARGLYDQNAATNRAPRFHVFPKQAFTAQGEWGIVFFESDMFQKHLAAKNAIELPHPIIVAMVAERRPINAPWQPYLKYTADIVRHAAERSTATANAKLGTAFASPNDRRVESDEPLSAWVAAFNAILCGYISAAIDRLAPRLCSGELPLCNLAPGFNPNGAESRPHSG